MNSLEEKIRTIIEEDINPGLAMHDGSATLTSIRDTDDLLIVNILFKGSCSGCEGARGGTLLTIQNFLKQELDIKSLIVVPEEE